MEFKKLRSNLKKDYTDFLQRKIAIVADWSVQMLGQAIRGYGWEENLDLQIYEAAFDQMEAELLDPQSSLYAFQPDCILLFPCAETLQRKFQNASLQERKTMGKREADRIRSLCASVGKHSDATVLLSNYCELGDGVFGNYAGVFEESFLFQERTLNARIAQIAQEQSQVCLLDVLSLQDMHGRKTMFDERLYYLTKTAFAMDFLPVLAEQIVRLVRTLQGKVQKCLVTDLDNTLWGGVIGDDGMEGIQIGSMGIGMAFSDLQGWIKELSQRGIAIAVCSKNNDEIAREPFLKHKEMILRLEDISVFLANWEDKASNIRKIQQILNIGMDSIVFLDDNPFERNLVRRMLPDVVVPELPEDPTKYLSTLQGLGLFETVKISAEDRKRTRRYREEADRKQLQDAFTDIEAYLESLEMRATVKPFDAFSMPRVAQLSQRSNQFNLRTKRYGEQDLAKMVRDAERYETMAVELRDQFGEYGIICVVILERIESKTWFLDTLLMSCRVLKRSVEEFVFNHMVEQARKAGIEQIVGEYLPTKKNGMVKELLSNYGFVLQEAAGEGDRWLLQVRDYVAKRTFVEECDE